MSLNPRPSDNDNRIIVEWEGVSYAVNQRTLNRFGTAEELKANLYKFLGYSINDIWFHKNRDGTWAIATGVSPPDTWPEDELVYL